MLLPWGTNLDGSSISGQSPYPTYAHWDGDSVLFTNTGTSAIDFKVGKLSFNGGEIIDRDLSGQQAATHDPLGFSAFNVGDPMHPAGACKTEYCSGKLLMGSRPSDPQWTDNSNNELLKAPRADGYSDGTTNVFQGVRAFDNTAGQWTAPDAYAGDVHDPMSQKPFMWNKNNPLQYSDPSGYYTFDNGTSDQQKQFDAAAKAMDKGSARKSV